MLSAETKKEKENRCLTVSISKFKKRIAKLRKQFLLIENHKQKVITLPLAALTTKQLSSSINS